MDTLDEILGAFEEALELERELGTRTIPCDRALLLPPRPTPTGTDPATGAPKMGTDPATGAPKMGTDPATAAPKTGTDLGTVAPKVGTDLGTAAPKVGTDPVRPKADGAKTASGAVDFAFIVTVLPEGGAATLLDKMIAAMGYSRANVAIVTASAAAQVHPPARVYVVLGSDAFRTFAPGQRAALGLWTQVAEVPTVVTYSPARILAYFGNDEAGLKKAKMQIWTDLRAALAQIGKQPPARRA